MVLLHGLPLAAVLFSTCKAIANIGFRQTPALQNFALRDLQNCTLDAALNSSFDGDLNLAAPLADSAGVTQFLKAAEKEEDAQNYGAPGAKKEWKTALREYKTARRGSMEKKKAKQRLMHAMTALLEVPLVNSKSLEAEIAKKEKDLLVVFYAPWCSASQSFVIHDGNGAPQQAPLEIFNRNIRDSGAGETLSVIRFDVSVVADIPSGFKVKTVPTIYMVSADGRKVRYTDGQVSSASLVHFIEKNSLNTNEIGAVKRLL
jgi:thiol-disulfide isomerase/thioredoxin